MSTPIPAALRGRILRNRAPHLSSHAAMAEILAAELTDAGAATIASWWASPGAIGAHLAAYATGAPVSLGALIEDIDATVRHDGPRMEIADQDALTLLSRYVTDQAARDARDHEESNR